MSPLGGTELQYELLYKYVDNKLLENFSITTSVPEKTPLSLDKINILWQFFYALFFLLRVLVFLLFPYYLPWPL